MTQIARRIHLLIVGSTLAVLTSACGAAGAATLSPDGRQNLTEITSNAQRSMILFGRAQNTLVADCVQRAGFEFHASSSLEVGNARGGLTIGLLTPDLAARDGYGIYAPHEHPDSESAVEHDRRKNLDYLDSLNADDKAEYMNALRGRGDEDAMLLELNDGTVVGIPTGGCRGAAAKQLLGDDLNEVMQVFYEVQFLSLGELNDRPKVREAEGEWSRCMETTGYRFAAPSDAERAGLDLRRNEETMSSEEALLATTDARCRIDSGLIDVVNEEAAELNAKALDDNAELLSIWAGLEEQVLGRTGDVLGVNLTSG